MQSSRLSRAVVFTILEPAPWYLGFFAKSPIIATFVLRFSGKIPLLFLSKVILSAAAWYARSWCFFFISSGRLSSPSFNTAFLVASFTALLVENISDKSSLTLASMSLSSILPLFTAAISSLAESPPGAGISSVDPAFTPSAWSFEPPQSVTTVPLKPHSFLNISDSKCSFSFAYVPFIRL